MDNQFWNSTCFLVIFFVSEPESQILRRLSSEFNQVGTCYLVGIATTCQAFMSPSVSILLVCSTTSYSLVSWTLRYVLQEEPDSSMIMNACVETGVSST